jgi:hypothetical protein
MSPATPSSSDADQRRFVTDVERHLGRSLTDPERKLALSLVADKTAAMVAREIAGAPITDPKKIRPEHKDTADEAPPAAGATGLDG